MSLRDFQVVLCLMAMLGAMSACKASKPGKTETAFMTRAKRWVFVGNKSEKNPLQFNRENLESGKQAFASYCFVCHGLDGQNTGVPFADRMSPPVPKLTSPEVQGYTDGQLKWVIENGISPSGMPASKGVLNQDEIWSIVLYLRHLPKPGSLGEPAVYSGDCNSGMPAQQVEEQAVSE